jgi:hypothetical protein
VIHATFFVVVPMMVQHCFTDASLPSGVSARHKSGLTLYKCRGVAFGGSPQTPHLAHLAHLPGTLLRNSRRKRRPARAPRCSNVNIKGTTVRDTLSIPFNALVSLFTAFA